jgi:hypothetical protein
MSAKKENQVPGQVISLAANRCQADGCKSKPARAGFCEEHFDWFKAGLITKEGHRAMDFDKKYQHYLASKKKAA